MPTSEEVEKAVRRGSEKLSLKFPMILPTECSQFHFCVSN